MNYLQQHWRWPVSVWIAFVFVQSLFFKFGGSPETEHIFGVLGETFQLPWFATHGAYLVGAVELVAAVLLFSRYWAWGALLAFEIMSGAIVFHLFTPLGVVMPVFNDAGERVGGDGGTLFIMACLTWLSSLALVVKDWTSSSSQLRKALQRR